MLQDHGCEANTSHEVPVYATTFTGSHCTYPLGHNLGGWLHTKMVCPSKDGDPSYY